MLRPGSVLFDTGVRRYIEFRASIMWPEPIALQRDLVGPRGRSVPSVIPFGALDKYDLAALQPIYPAGYADSALSPHLPQDKAEIMGGRTPIDEQPQKSPPALQTPSSAPKRRVKSACCDHRSNGWP